MKQSEFDLSYFLNLFKSRIRLLSTLLISTVLFFSVLFLLIPKKYKSISQITIYSKYFQNPLIRDFISEQFDSAEMKNQRHSIILQALDDAFIDHIGEEFKLYKTGPNDSKRGYEREELRKHFDVFAVSGDSFQIEFFWSQADIAYKVSQAALDHIQETLIDQRKKTIVSVRNAIRSRMEEMTLFMSASPKTLGAASKTRVQEELVQIRSQIKTLLEQYKEAHPKVVQLRAKEQALVRYLNQSNKSRVETKENSENQSIYHTSPEALAGSEIEPGSKEVYQDLLKKYNYLNVAIDMEKPGEVNYYAVVAAPVLPISPTAPNFFNFLTYGLAAGILLALFVLLYDEFVRFSSVNAEIRAKSWGIPLLGSVPTLVWDESSKNKERATENQPNDWN